jgi:FkbM family methyltransferase
MASCCAKAITRSAKSSTLRQLLRKDWTLKSVKDFVKGGFRKFGLSVSKAIEPPPAPFLHARTDLLLDVGANIGQYARLTRAQGYKNRLVSFEPLPDAHTALVKAARSDKAWIIHPRCAVGAEVGETDINVAKNSYSSSVLPMLAAHASADPDSIYVGKERTQVVTLDSIFPMYYHGSENVFLKIDTQGYEKRVLEGAKQSLKHIKGVQLELSIVPLYESEQLYDYFFEFFKEHGFTLWSLIPGFADKTTGRLLQFDGVFLR